MPLFLVLTKYKALLPIPNGRIGVSTLILDDVLYFWAAGEKINIMMQKDCNIINKSFKNIFFDAVCLNENYLFGLWLLILVPDTGQHNIYRIN